MKKTIWVLVCDYDGIESSWQSASTFWFNFPTDQNLIDYGFSKKSERIELMDKKYVKVNKYNTYHIEEVEEGGML